MGKLAVQTNIDAADVKQSGRNHKRDAEREKDWKRDQGQIMKRHNKIA